MALKLKKNPIECNYISNTIFKYNLILYLIKYIIFDKFNYIKVK